MPVYIDEILPKTLVFGNSTHYYSLFSSNNVLRFFQPETAIDGNLIVSATDAAPTGDALLTYPNSIYGQIRHLGVDVENPAITAIHTFKHGDNQSIQILKDNSYSVSIDLGIVGLKINKTFPGKNGYTSYNGDFKSYTPNIKHSITFSFDFLPESVYSAIIGIADKPVVISPEPTEITALSPFQGKSFLCQLQDDNLEFDYTLKVKAAGYKGTLTFLES